MVGAAFMAGHLAGTQSRSQWHAPFWAAEGIRSPGPITLIGDEAERPYERPPLSKDYLMGKAERETIYVHPQQWYAKHDVDLRLGVTVTEIDPSAHQVALADGSRIGCAKLLRVLGRQVAGVFADLHRENEHWASALHQPQAAAMLGQDVT